MFTALPRRLVATLALLGFCLAAGTATADLQSTDYPSIQAAIDANPGRMIYIPNGDHHIDDVITITRDGTGLCGPGRIIQDNVDKDIISVNGAHQVHIKEITLTRAEGKFETQRNGINAENCKNLVIEGVGIYDNRGPGGGVRLDHCDRPTVRNCIVQNYKAPAIDDRTKSPEMGYAFKCVDGTGMKIFYCSGAQIIGNRIVETVFLPTIENRDKYDLGKVTVIPEKPGPMTPKKIYEKPYTNNWHQGSGLICGGLGNSQYSQIIGNYIENAAQGLDIHADYVIVSNNIVNGGMMGMKAMHGSKHVIISNNQFSRVDLYGILLCPGVASHDALPTSGTTPAQGPNIDGGTVVTGNVISDFGFGGQAWNWETEERDGPHLNAISLQGEQLPDDPPLRDVIIANNIVYDTGRDKMIVDGEPKVVAPRYRYALWIDQNRRANPRNIKVYNNIFHPGSSGLSNVDLETLK